MLDNKFSTRMKNFICYADAQNQLVPSGLHCALIYNRAIQTLKHHLIARLSSCDPKFPLHLWCCIIQQAVLTLNLLRPEWLNHHLSTKTFPNGEFDFNWTPLSTPEKKSLFLRGKGTGTNLPSIEWMPGTLDRPHSTTDATWCMSQIHTPSKWQRKPNSSQINAPSEVLPLTMPPTTQLIIWTRRWKTHPCHLPLILETSKSGQSDHWNN